MCRLVWVGQCQNSPVCFVLHGATTLERMEMDQLITDESGGTTPGAPVSFYRLEEILERLTVSRATLYRMIRKSGFPRSVHLTTNRVAWPRHLVDAWIDARIRGDI